MNNEETWSPSGLFETKEQRSFFESKELSEGYVFVKRQYRTFPNADVIITVSRQFVRGTNVAGNSWNVSMVKTIDPVPPRRAGEHPRGKDEYIEQQYGCRSHN